MHDVNKRSEMFWSSTLALFRNVGPRILSLGVQLSPMGAGDRDQPGGKDWPVWQIPNASRQFTLAATGPGKQLILPINYE